MRELNYCNEDEIEETVYLYEMQTKAFIWDTLKKNYERVSQFKAKLVMSTLRNTLVEWNAYTQHKVENNDKMESFLEYVVTKRYSKLMQVWKNYSAYN